MKMRSLAAAFGLVLLAAASACVPPVGDPCEAFDACPEVQAFSDLNSR